MSNTQRGCIPWLFESVAVNIGAHGPLGATGRTLETPVATNVAAVIDYAYTPAGDDCPAEAAVRSVKLVSNTFFDGEHFSANLTAGYDLLKLLPEIEVERLAEMLVQREQNKAEAL